MTPVKIWARDQQGQISSKIESSRGSTFGGEEFRSDADDLDAEIDALLDRVIALRDAGRDENGTDNQFVKRWAIGRGVAESGVMDSPHAAAESPSILWLAIARKCQIGVRANGETEDKWRSLLPNRSTEPNRVERDIFALGLWLQEQDLDEAFETFGGRLTNASEFHRREAIRSLKMRRALLRWLRSLDPKRRAKILVSKDFVNLAMALQRRWPSRGPGSAKRPTHYRDDELDHEVSIALKGINSSD